MSEVRFCERQERCPLLLAAIEAKVEAESKRRLADAEFAAARREFNALYVAARDCRAKQLRADKGGGYAADVLAANDAAKELDRRIADLAARARERKAAEKPVQPEFPNIGGREYHHD